MKEYKKMLNIIEKNRMEGKNVVTVRRKTVFSPVFIRCGGNKTCPSCQIKKETTACQLRLQQAVEKKPSLLFLIDYDSESK